MGASEIIALILSALQGAITSAPAVVDLVTKGKDLISALFTAKIITVEQQNAAHSYVDAIASMVDSGLVPPGLQVQPDPIITPVPPPAP